MPRPKVAATRMRYLLDGILKPVYDGPRQASPERS